MKAKFLIFLVLPFMLLSSCSDYKKVGFDGKIKYEINRQMSISPDGKVVSYTLTGIRIGDKIIQLKEENIKLTPNTKQTLVTNDIGDIKIKIYENKDQNSFDVVLWMTDEQISKFE